MFAPWKKSYDKPRQHIKNQRHHFANKGPYSPNYTDLLLILPVKVKVKSLSRVRLLVTPWTVAHQAPPSMGFSRQDFTSSHVQMWELDHKEGWALRNRFFWIVVLEKTLESPLDCKEFKPVNLKGNQPWIFTGRTVVKLRLHYFGHLMSEESIPRKRPWC